MEVRVRKGRVRPRTTLKADKGYILIVDSTDCDVDMDLGKITIRTKRLSVQERKI